MSGSSKGITLVAKLLGGNKIVGEMEKIGSSVKKTGADAEEADVKAGSSGHGWELFRKRVRGVGEDAKSSHSMVTKMIGGLAGLASGYLSISGIKNLASNTSTMADEAEKFNRVTGASIQSSLDWIAVANSRGVGQKLLAQGMVLLSKNMYAAERQQDSYNNSTMTAAAAGHVYKGLLGSQASAIKELGLSWDALHKMNPQEQFLKIGQALSEMTNASERSRIGALLFGRGFKELAPLMTSDSLGMEKQLKVAREFMPEIGGNGPKAFQHLREAQSESKIAWEGFQMTLGLKVLPVILKVFHAFSHLMLDIEKGKGVFGVIGGAISVAVKAFEAILGPIAKSRLGVILLTSALAVLAAMYLEMKIASFIAAMKELTIFTWLQVIATTALNVVMAIFDVLALGLEILIAIVGAPVLIVIGVIVLLVAAFIIFEKQIIKAWNWIKSEWHKLEAWLSAPIKAALKWISTAWKNVEGFITKPVLAAVKWVETAFNNTIKFIENVGNKIGRAATGMWDGIKDAFKSVINWIIGAWDSLHFNLPKITLPFGLGSFGGEYIGVPQIPKLAMGGDLVSAGSVVVGDAGPELLSLPAGARVTPLGNQGINGLISSAMGGEQSGDLTVYVMLEGKAIGKTTLTEFRRREARK